MQLEKVVLLFYQIDYYIADTTKYRTNRKLQRKNT